MPTQLGLRMFVDGMLEVGDPAETDREKIDATMGDNAADVGRVAGPRRLRAVGGHARGVAGAEPETRSADQAYRIRIPVAGSGAGRAGLFRRACGEPAVHTAARADAVVDARGCEFSQCAWPRGARFPNCQTVACPSRSRSGGKRSTSLHMRLSKAVLRCGRAGPTTPNG